MLVGRMGDARFVRRVRGRDYQDTIELELLDGLPRQRQMRFVNRVERAAEDRQPQVAYALSIFTEFTRTSLTGRSCALRGKWEIFSTTA